MTVKIGTVELNNVVDWNEEEETSIPKKRIVRRPKVTTQAEYFSCTPRKIRITAKMTSVEYANLVTLMDTLDLQPLYDYDGVTLVDYVWIENLHRTWARNEDNYYPWVVEITLICWGEDYHFDAEDFDSEDFIAG